MNVNVQQWVQALAAWSGLDEYIVLGLIFMTAGLVGKASVKLALKRCAGCHLKVNDIANGVLRLLDSPEKWETTQGGIAYKFNGSVVTVKTEDGSVGVDNHGKAVLAASNGDFNRWERRLIKAKAKKVEAQRIAWAESERRNVINNALRELAPAKA
jgi:hypothetical protein